MALIYIIRSQRYYRNDMPHDISLFRLDVARIMSLLEPVLSAFMYLHSQHVIIGYFSLNSILLSSENVVRLAQYGLHCISGSAKNLEYCIYSSWHLPPERFLQAGIKNGFICRAGDIWSFGIAVLELSIIMNDENKSQSNVSNDYSVYDSENDESSLGEDAKHMRESLEKGQIEATRDLPINEAFFLWKLCGSNIETILINHGIIKANPSVLALPNLVDGDCFMYGNADIRKYEFTFDIFILPSINFRDRMKSLNESKFYISFEMEEKTREIYDLSLMVKERDIEYQGRRMLVLRRLLSSYPFKKSLLFCECCHDIPPLYRANLWSALLNIYWDVEKRFIAIDTFSPHASDRQLLVDIPRCHQVWDVLLLSDSSFPLFVGLAIMEQLRTGLITTHFNDAILLFSDLPDLNMERLVQCSLNYYNTVPASCTFRQHASKHVREEYAMTHYTVTELNEFCCPRISAADIIRLTEHSSLLVVDVRPQYEFLEICWIAVCGISISRRVCSEFINQ
ncbi:hypothetical protein X798_01870 [Onchocerca flexuosa]|uniref:Protein kinase domain-containing protein n=1 Tax=Onchocerca flexuosa TaxID=387005 RepID=A0A238C104_9BILA|nr:hypothetical protein X798_01870 [Onchocerca flexuosa]